jgi:hypothetical protein
MDIDRVLRDLARAQAEAVAASALPPTVFADRVVANTRATSGRGLGDVLRRRPSIAFVAWAALIAALLIAGAIAIGTGRLRLPWADDHPLSGAVADCPPFSGPALPDGQVMLFDVSVQADTPGERPSMRLTLLEDGLLVIAPEDRNAAQVVAADPAMTARRLSASGVQLIKEAVERSGLTVPGCHLYFLTDAPLRGLTFRGSDGVHSQTAWGYYGGFIRLMSTSEDAAADVLVTELEHPEAWLPAEAWLDVTERPHVPDRWVFSTIRLPSAEAPAYGSTVDTSLLPRADSVALPGGATLLDFGIEMREPDSVLPGGEITRGVVHRCEIVGEVGARAIAATLGSGTSDSTRPWWYADGDDQISVELAPLLTTESECSWRLLGIAPPPESTVVPTEFVDFDPCDLVPLDTVTALLRTPSGFSIEAHRRTDFRGDTAYVGCEYYDDADGTSWSGTVSIAVRTRTTTAVEAAEVAKRWLGEAAIDTIEGRPIWLNGCMASSPAITNPYCFLAIAVSAEPYFLIVQPNVLTMADSEMTARALVPIILANLPAWEERESP